MSLATIFNSPSQKRTILTLSAIAVSVAVILTFTIGYLAPPTPFWIVLNSILTSIIASAVFAFVCGLCLIYLFDAPTFALVQSVILPADVAGVLRSIAKSASHYRVYVRTGRHFRAEILPIIINQARTLRRKVQIDVILLDYRDREICTKYSNYRHSTSFDKQVWSKDYVQKEILATVLAVIRAVNNDPELIDADVYLSRRLSIFRIEGSTEQILITREDPKDSAMHLLKSHRDFSAYLTELSWIKEDAYHVQRFVGGRYADTLAEIFNDVTITAQLEQGAVAAVNSPSPYGR